MFQVPTWRARIAALRAGHANHEYFEGLAQSWLSCAITERPHLNRLIQVGDTDDKNFIQAEKLGMLFWEYVRDQNWDEAEHVLDRMDALEAFHTALEAECAPEKANV